MVLSYFKWSTTNFTWITSTNGTTRLERTNQSEEEEWKKNVKEKNTSMYFLPLTIQYARSNSLIFRFIYFPLHKHIHMCVKNTYIYIYKDIRNIYYTNKCLYICMYVFICIYFTQNYRYTVTQNNQKVSMNAMQLSY